MGTAYGMRFYGERGASRKKEIFGGAPGPGRDAHRIGGGQCLAEKGQEAWQILETRNRQSK